MQLSALCRRRGLSITTQDIFQYPTLAKLNARVLVQVDSQAPSASFPLSPVQEMLLKEKSSPFQSPSRSLLLRLPRPITLIELESMVQTVIHRQPSLSMRFTDGEDGRLTQTVTSLIRGSYRCSHIQISAAAMAGLDSHLERTNLETGPLFLADLITTENGDSQHLLLIAPQVVADDLSWKIILNELNTCMAGGEFSSSIATGSFQSWCEGFKPQMNGESEGKPAERSLSNYWGSVDFSSTKSSATISTEFHIDSSRTALICQRGEHALRAEPAEILLGVLLHAFRATFPGRDGLQTFIERDGRTADVSQVVGQFTAYTPMTLELGYDDNVVDMVRRSKHAYRKACKEHPIHFEQIFPVEAIFRWKEALSPGSEVDGLFLQKVSSYPDSSEERPVARKAGLFELTVSKFSSSLTLSLAYSESMLQQDAISQWFQLSQDTLDELLGQLEYLPFRPTLSDFPQLSITSTELESLILEILGQHDTLSPSDIADIYPASFIQQGMLLSQARDPQAYWSRLSWEVRSRDGSSVGLQRLQGAWQQVAMRHSILRTLFVQSQDGSHCQVLLKSPPLPVKILPLDVPGEVQATTDQASGVLEGRTLLPWRLTLKPLSDGSVTCEIHISHALMDGDSMQLLIRDVEQAYDAEQSHKPLPLYSQYVEYLNQVARDSALEYWASYLDGTEPCHFPSFPAPQSTTAVDKLVDLDIVIEDTPQLFSFCNEEGITLFNVVQLAWAIVLQCYTGNETVAFGYLTSGRDVPIDGVEDMVGPLINMLIARIDLRGDQSVRKHLHECRDRYQQSLPNQHCSLADIYRALGSSGIPMFNSIITYQKLLPISTNATIEFNETLNQQPTEFDIVLNVNAGRNDAAVSFSYWGNKIPPDLARSIGRTFSAVLGEITTRPNAPVSAINLVSAEDQAQIMDWNRSPTATVSACIHDLVKEECIAHPDRLAIYAWDGSLTYQQLWDHSSALTMYLINQGVGPEVPVPICLERSVWVPISKLAVLRAGGICVPLDPSAPVERIQAILDDAMPEVILVSSATADIDFQSSAKKIIISPDIFAHSAGQIQDPASPAQPSNAAYILYTSGSTGRPKGIILQHDGLSTSLRDQSRSLSISGETRALQFASYTFDLSVWEVFSVLISGGRVCIPSQMARMNELAAFISDAKINWVAFTPSFVRLFQPKDFPGVRTMVTTGEALPQDVADTWSNKVRLVNAYGPTECTICAVQPVEAGRWIVGTIGWPVGGSGWVVDPSNINRPMPIGAIGELIFEGPLVAREYFRRPDATKAAFVSTRPSWLPTPSPYDGCRLYRTGDLVRYNPDGSHRYFGRKDAQIKLRGHRIELEEVEFNIR
ncbi:NRPS, partial [Arthroderma sp. PD_2]